MSPGPSDVDTSKLRLGMVGGGPGAFIGAVHRAALAMDGRFQLVAGAFSADPQKSQAMGRELGLDPLRVYGSEEEMAAGEAALSENRRIHAVCIVTPNALHFEQAQRFLEAGFDVICDKPLTTSLADAETLATLVESTGRVFCLTHNYSGYPMVEQARALVASGELGSLRKVYVEYLQGWLGEPIEASGQKQAAWRTDPQQAGACGAMGDIGTHAHHLVEHVMGSPMTSLFASLDTFVEGRALDDDGMVLFRLANGASGSLVASQVCTGQENRLTLKVFGSEGGLEWRQEHPNDLAVFWKDRPSETWRPGNSWTTSRALEMTRLPSGHPEGYLEAFANHYRAFAAALDGKPLEAPTVHDGVRGLRFLNAVVQSARDRGWVALSP